MTQHDMNPMRKSDYFAAGGGRIKAIASSDPHTIETAGA
jgi:hypothetical protein